MVFAMFAVTCINNSMHNDVAKMIHNVPILRWSVQNLRVLTASYFIDLTLSKQYGTKVRFIAIAVAPASNEQTKRHKGLPSNHRAESRTTWPTGQTRAADAIWRRSFGGDH